ncbi:Increased recombination centers protein 22 [Rhinocladiella similis]
MVRFLDLALFFFGFQAAGVFSQAPNSVDEEVEDPSTSPALAVTVEASFPNAEIFGIKLVNGKPTEAVLTFMNEEPDPVTIQFVGGSLWTPDLTNPRIVRNLTTAQYAVEITPGEKESLPYTFQTNMHPQDLRLNLAAVVSSHNTFYTLQAFNGTVSVVEQDASIFDPQILFLYCFLLACAVAVGYFFYTIWIVPYFPQKRKQTTKKASAKKIEVGSVQSDNEGPAISTGAKTYNEEWIPTHHIQRPEARRVKSGGRPKSRGKPE